MRDRRTGTTSELHRDLVFLGTGFDARIPRLVRELTDGLGIDHLDVTRQYRVLLEGEGDRPTTAGLYMQGVNEDTHGISDSLLSVLAQRAEEICLDIVAHRDGNGQAKTPEPVAAVSAEESHTL